MTDAAMIRELRAEVKRLVEEKRQAFNEGVAACARAMEPHKRAMLTRHQAANMCWAQQRDPRN